jgi:hypothetical protein
MSADARDIFSTGDHRLAMREADGWVVTTIRDSAGHIVHAARIALSELLPNVKTLESRLKALGNAQGRPIDLFLGFTPEGDHLCAAVTADEMSIVEVSADGVARRLLCGPYPANQAHAMAQAVIQAAARR